MSMEGAEAFFPLRATTTADSRCSRRRSAGGDGGTTLFRSASSDEDGGNLANIAASGASNQNTAPRIARRCPGRTNEQTRFSSVSERGRQRPQSAIRASGASNQTLREQPHKIGCERRESRAAGRRRRERRRSFLCERRRRRRIPSAMREQPHKNRLRASGIARRRTEPGWRAAVLDERESRHVFRLRTSEEGSG